MLSCTSSSHHQVSLSSFLCFDDTPSTFLAVSHTMFAVVVQSSGNSSSPPKARLISSLNSSQQSSFFNFHHFILGSAFVILRFLVSKVILHTNSRCCLATLSPAITLQSLSGMPSYIWYSPLAYSILHSYKSPCVPPSFWNTCSPQPFPFLSRNPPASALLHFSPCRHIFPLHSHRLCFLLQHA